MKALPNIPGYDILTCLGGGAITSVYSARECDTEYTRAIKVLRPDWEDQPVAVKLLQREARACLSVRHPHLVRIVHEHVMTQPHYLVMEFLPGESLRRRMRRDYSLNVPTALWVARQTAEALTALHRKGFIHGDVKPENIRLVDLGKAILLDLGFAHHPGENASFADMGYVLGTVNYLAPELCSDAPQDDVRADIYSLGITLFEMLTGQLPFPAGTPLETMHRHRTEEPASIADFLPGITPALVEMVERMLSRDPNKRPRAARLVHDLIQMEIPSIARRHAA